MESHATKPEQVLSLPHCSKQLSLAYANLVVAALRRIPGCSICTLLEPNINEFVPAM